MTDILIARAVNGRLGFSILHDAVPGWEHAETMLGPYAAQPLEPGDAAQMRLRDIALIADSLPEATIAEVVKQWRLVLTIAARLE